MTDLPVGKPGEEDGVAVVEAFKKNEGSKSKRRHEIQAQASKILAEVRGKLEEDFVYVDDDGDEFDNPEQIMARMLAGKKLTPRAREEDKPLVVTKGTISKIGEEPK